MLEFISRHRRILLVLVVPYAILIGLFTYRVDARLVAPGNIQPIGGFIEVEAEETEGDFHSIYVMGVNRPTIFQRLLGEVDEQIKIDEIPEARRDLSDRVQFEGSQIARRASFHAAFISALKSEDIEVEYERYVVVQLIYDYAEHDGLELGDRILTINDKKDLGKAIDEAACGEWHTFEVARAGERYEIDVLRRESDCSFGLTLRRVQEIVDAPIPHRFTESLVGGPSGGLMQALHVYNQLTPLDLTGGRLVAGSGTIDPDGNVGSVGSIPEKLITAHANDVELFFVPAGSNYEDALNTKQTLDLQIELIAVESLSEALDYLLEGDGP